MKNRNKINLTAAALILVLFILSIVVPSFQPVAKVGALLLYALVSLLSIKEQKERGEDIEKSLLFTVAVILIIGYLLFFV